MRCAVIATTILMMAATGCGPASAADVTDHSGTFGGVTVRYKVLLPPGYDPSRAYPAVLVFTGGPQTFDMAGNTIRADWQAEAEKRGYIVISPAAPDAGLFFRGGDRAFPAFLDAMAREHRISRLHVAGHSNGGLSAFHIAAKYPERFKTVTGYPGLLEDGQSPDRLKSMCVFMHVGDRDPSWGEAMKAQADDLRRAGLRVRYTVEPDQVHRLKAGEIDLSRRLFDEIESCR